MQINGKKEERLASTLVPRVFAARSSHVLLISVTQKENKRLLKAYYQILKFFLLLLSVFWTTLYLYM